MRVTAVEEGLLRVEPFGNIGKNEKAVGHQIPR